MENGNGHADLGEFFDFGEAAMPDVMERQAGNRVDEGHSMDPAHGMDATDG
jgi:hypothetical protein